MESRLFRIRRGSKPQRIGRFTVWRASSFTARAEAPKLVSSSGATLKLEVRTRPPVAVVPDELCFMQGIVCLCEQGRE